MEKEDAIEYFRFILHTAHHHSDAAQAAQIAILALRCNTENEAPLTLEQLREMDGQPVWVDFTGGTIKMDPGWFIVNIKPGREVYLAGKVSIYRVLEEYGETWRAYSYPPAHTGQKAREPEWTANLP